MRKLLIKSEGVNFANQFTTIFESANTYTANIDRGLLWDQCWTVGAIFTFGRSRMFSPDKLRPSAVDGSRSRRINSFKHAMFENFQSETLKVNW